jgi:hypothetical protein
VEVSELMKGDNIGMSGPQRKFAQLALRDPVVLTPATFSDPSFYLGTLSLQMDFFKKGTVSKVWLPLSFRLLSLAVAGLTWPR